MILGLKGNELWVLDSVAWYCRSGHSAYIFGVPENVRAANRLARKGLVTVTSLPGGARVTLTFLGRMVAAGSDVLLRLAADRKAAA